MHQPRIGGGMMLSGPLSAATVPGTRPLRTQRHHVDGETLTAGVRGLPSSSGVSATSWSMDDPCGMMDAVAPKPGKRVPYKRNRIAAT